MATKAHHHSHMSIQNSTFFLFFFIFFIYLFINVQSMYCTVRMLPLNEKAEVVKKKKKMR